MLPMFRSIKFLALAALGLVVLLPVLGWAFLPSGQASRPVAKAAEESVAKVSASASTAVLIDQPVQGSGKLETEIARLQKVVNEKRQRAGALEQLGWLLVAKARQDGDAGLYLRARACADALEADDSAKPLDALLLRGHVHHQLHQFAEAEAIANELVSQRGNPFDYAMLGDARFDRGEIAGAAEAYQKLMELRPGLPAYLRAGEMRWLHGDVDGCLEVMLMAVRAGSSRQPEPLAWAFSRLSHFLLLANRLDEARAASDRALDLIPDYLPAFGAKGRALMAQGDFAGAAPILARAAKEAPQPSYQWAYFECLRALQRDQEAAALWQEIQATGEREDPRTYALLLATRGRHPETALRLARRELEVRHDVYTHDALALALLAPANPADPSRISEARAEIEKALTFGTRDPRLFLHAALIYERAGDLKAAQQWAAKANALRPALFPSETALLDHILTRLPAMSAHAVTVVNDHKNPGFGTSTPETDNQTTK